MTKNSKISWTTHTWNPLYAIRKDNGKRGWMCVMHGDGCTNCYAATANVTWDGGNGLPYTQAGLEQVDLKLSMDPKSQTSVDWPLRAQTGSTIFLASMTDWMAKFYPSHWQSLLLGTMALASWHNFITLTKRWENLVSMLTQMDDTPMRQIAVPADKSYLNAITRANLKKYKFDQEGEMLSFRADPASARNLARTPITELQSHAQVPWPPRNVAFGLSICNVYDADKMIPVLLNMRKKWPTMNIVVSQEPALEIIDWEKMGLAAGTINQLIWGGESGPDARMAHVADWFTARDWAKKTGTPIWFKQTGDVLARQLGLSSPHGDDVNEDALRDLEPIQQPLDLTGRLV